MTIKIRPTLEPEAQRLVEIYDQTPGSSGPYCLPEGVAAILDEIATYGEHWDATDLRAYANLLRGNAP